MNNNELSRIFWQRIIVFIDILLSFIVLCILLCLVNVDWIGDVLWFLIWCVLAALIYKIHISFTSELNRRFPIQK